MSIYYLFGFRIKLIIYGLIKDIEENSFRINNIETSYFNEKSYLITLL